MCFAVNKFSEHTPNEGTGKVWLTTKVTGSEHGTAKTAKAVDQSAEIAKKYGLKWVRSPFSSVVFAVFRMCTIDARFTQDLFLLHDPTAGKEKRLEAWKVLLEKRDQGVIRTAGVSNFVRFLPLLRASL